MDNPVRNPWRDFAAFVGGAGLGLALVATGEYLSALASTTSPSLSEAIWTLRPAAQHFQSSEPNSSPPEQRQARSRSALSATRAVLPVSFVPSASTPPTGSTATAVTPQRPPPDSAPSQLQRALQDVAALEATDEAIVSAKSQRVAALGQQLREADERTWQRVNAVQQAGGAPNLDAHQ